MDDTEILNIFMDSTGIRLNSHLNNWDKIKKLTNYQEIYDYLINRFPDNSLYTDLREIIYRIKNKIETLPKCPVCGNTIKISKRFNHYDIVCEKCRHTVKGKEIIKQHKQLTLFNNYGVNNVFALDSVKNKIKQTNLMRYGAENINSLATIRDKIKQTNMERYGTQYGLSSNIVKDKRKDTCLYRYGVDNVFAADEIKLKIEITNLSKYGVKNYSLTPEFQEKINKTKRNHNTFNTSRLENNIVNYLKEKYKNIYTQYKSELYPYKCDIFIKDINLYIEINAHWTHGMHPFNKDNENDIKKLNHWQDKSNNSNYYKHAMEVWTIKDIDKRNIALQNKLKYLEIFTNNFNIAIYQILQYIENI